MCGFQVLSSDPGIRELTTYGAGREGMELGLHGAPQIRRHGSLPERLSSRRGHDYTFNLVQDSIPNGFRYPKLGCQSACAGYFKRPDANEWAFRWEWFDQGVTASTRGLRESALFFISGRIKELFIRGGVNVSPPPLTKRPKVIQFGQECSLTRHR